MKKFFLFVFPLFLAVIVFFAIMFLFQSGPSGRGSLQITSNPVSKVYLDGKLIGQTPLCECELKTMLNSGDYVVRLIPQGGFIPFEQKITINKLTLTVVDATFNADSTEGSVISLSPLSDKKDIELMIVSFPDKSDVFLDNNFVGTTPFLINNITESDHDLKISKSGYQDELIKISTHLGYRLSLVAFLGANPVVIQGNSSAGQEATPSAIVQTSTPSATVAVPKIVVKSSVGYANVREDGSLDSTKIGEVYSGDIYSLLDEKDGWYQIKLNDGETGWINSSYAVKQ